MITLTAVKPCGCTIAAVISDNKRAVYPLLTSWIAQGLSIGRTESVPVVVGCKHG